MIGSDCFLFTNGDEDSSAATRSFFQHQLDDVWGRNDRQRVSLKKSPRRFCSVFSRECSRATGCHVVAEISFRGTLTTCRCVSALEQHTNVRFSLPTLIVPLINSCCCESETALNQISGIGFQLPAQMFSFPLTHDWITQPCYFLWIFIT